MSAGVYNPVLYPGQRALGAGTETVAQNSGTGTPAVPQQPANPGVQGVGQGNSPVPLIGSTATSAPATPTANSLQPSYLPTPPTALPTTYQNPYDPSTATSELTQAAGVQDQQQQQNLMSMLAAQGISPGSSAAQAAGQNLSTTQNAALDPSLVNAQEYGAGLNEQSGLSNAGAGNTMTLQNLQDLLQQQEFNSSAFNSAGTTSAELGNNDWLAELQGQLGLQGEGLGTAGSLAGDQANQQVPLDPSLFSDITQGVGAAASAAAPFLAASGGGSSPSTPSFDDQPTGDW